MGIYGNWMIVSELFGEREFQKQIMKVAIPPYSELATQRIDYFSNGKYGKYQGVVVGEWS